MSSLSKTVVRAVGLAQSCRAAREALELAFTTALDALDILDQASRADWTPERKAAELIHENLEKSIQSAERHVWSLVGADAGACILQAVEAGWVDEDKRPMGTVIAQLSKLEKFAEELRAKAEQC